MLHNCNLYITIGAAMKVLEFPTFKRWMKKLRNVEARQRINYEIRKIAVAEELLGDWKSVGDGVIELRFNFGKGYRVYVSVRGSELLLLLARGDKSSQRADIERAKALLKGWDDG